MAEFSVLSESEVWAWPVKGAAQDAAVKSASRKAHKRKADKGNFISAS
jgi:hypothetical protein